MKTVLSVRLTFADSNGPLCPSKRTDQGGDRRSAMRDEADACARLDFATIVIFRRCGDTRMAYSGRLFVWAISCLFGGCVVHASDRHDIGGFVLGAPFEAAQQHALYMGWRLTPLSHSLPGYWIVDGSSLSLFVCDGTVWSVAEQLNGGLEEFVARVSSMELQLGEPDIQIFSLPSGAGDISTIDARFGTDDSGATVQLQSIGGKKTLLINHWVQSDCDRPGGASAS